MTGTTLLYYTDNRLPEELARLVRRWLMASAQGRPMVAVAQDVIPEWPQTVVLRGLAPSHLAMCRQIVRALEEADTDTVAFCEHDCLYTPDHFAHPLADRGAFAYNEHLWFLQWRGPRRGEFSRFYRRALSGCVADRDLALRAWREKLDLAEHDHVFVEAAPGLRDATQCEPGTKDDRPIYAEAQAFLEARGLALTRHLAVGFVTPGANVDIRHGGNRTGLRFGHDVTRRIEPWGTIEDIERGPSCA